MSKMEWRLVGPYIGGRVVAVAGVPDQPNVFYMGGVQGGVWKTENAGNSWDNITDGKMGTISHSIGAIAVAPSNSKIIYVGTGESDIRGDWANGEGVYKSTDAGETWKYAGLKETRQTSAIVVDPHNANIAYVSSMGHVFKPNADRGVFKTTDGGKTWKKVLFVDDNTGANDVVMDSKNPNILYATMWQAQRTPWNLTSGGPGSGVYKSTDAGAHWTKISTHPGFAKGMLGKMGVAVAPNNSNIVYAIVQAKDGGVFRSDNAGATWTRVNDEWKLRQRAFYYMAIYVDPTNWKVAYAPNVDSVFKTTDGGKTWKPLGPGLGDNHIIWINPKNPKLMIIGDDGGANVSVDGGKTFSTTTNQPLSQFYHIVLDNQFPYHMYGAMQDAGAFEIPSASHEGLGLNVVHGVALGESTYVAVDPNDPTVTYGAAYYSVLARLEGKTGDEKNVTPWAIYLPGHQASDQKYRFGWTHPIMFSSAEPHTLFESAQVVFRSDDYGKTWKVISPDLTRNVKSTEGPAGGDVYWDQTGVETFPDISSLGFSPVNKDIIWAGSADGLVHVTQNGGTNWKDVTPKQLGTKWSQISSFEPSPTDACTAFVTASRYQWDDMRPYIYKTTDCGANWTPMTNGIPADQTVYAVRIDPREPRVMFAGTRSRVYVSLNGGQNWQDLALNLPPVQVRDIAINAREGEVAIATHGRSFWALDHLQQVEDLAREQSLSTASAQVFAPETAWLTHEYGGGGYGPSGDNPDYGTTVFFNLPSNYNGRTPATLSFEDANGKTIRSFNLHLKNKKAKKYSRDELTAMDAISAANYQLARDTAVEPGMNKFVWDMRYAGATEIVGQHLVPTDDFSDTLLGPTTLPGEYTVVLNYGGKTMKAPFKIQLDPRFNPPADALPSRLTLAMALSNKVDELDKTINEAQNKMKTMSGAKRAAVEKAVYAAYEPRYRSSEADIMFPSKLRDHLAMLMNSLDLSYSAPTAAEEDAAKQLESQADDAIAKIKSAAGM
ncbi:MAG TPA: hypothetical protein VFN49_07650 [Candidatus Aquilonibacter sp.]|nr:hypothetical protein [Candidatus Aquilonibacter sp.]